MNAIKYFLALAIFVLSVGCATTPTPLSEATPIAKDRVYAFQKSDLANSSKIIITRDQGLLGSACFYGLWIDSVLSARIDVGEVVQFYVQPGDHLLKGSRDPQSEGLCGADSGNWIQRETVLKAGETKRFRFSLNAGSIDIHRAD